MQVCSGVLQMCYRPRSLFGRECWRKLSRTAVPRTHFVSVACDGIVVTSIASGWTVHMGGGVGGGLGGGGGGGGGGVVGRGGGGGFGGADGREYGDSTAVTHSR